MKNTVYLQRKNKIIVNVGQYQLEETFLAAALKNIESLGYTFSLEVMERVKTLSKEEFLELYDQVLNDLKLLVGAHVRYKPMYPNFPKQVMDASQSELYLNALIHYLTLDLPVHEVRKRLPLLGQSRLKVIHLGDQDELLQIGNNLLRSKTSISNKDKQDVEILIQEFDEMSKLIPEEIPMKENVAIAGSLLWKYGKLPVFFLSRHIKTATDVLRLAVALSEGDVSLASATKFLKFSRPQRRLFLQLLEGCPNLSEDMMRYKNRWVRLGEILHPFEYKKQFPKSVESFDIIRNNKKIEKFNSQVETALENKDLDSVVTLLKERPGEFARRLDHLLRLSNRADSVIDSFQQIVSNISTTVLLQVRNHFQKRDIYGDLRTFFPKGNVAKVHAIANKLPEMADDLKARVAQICTEVLVARFAQLPPLGKVYLDPKLHDYLVPSSQRSASKTLRTIVRGSKLPIPEGNTIRFFTWWKQGMINNVHTGRVDIDLSAVLYDENWNYLEHISYTNLKSETYQAFHSGDIVEAPNGACEFIDLDIPSILSYGGRYVVMSLYSFTEHPYCNLPECFAGWMIRQHPGSGEVFEPKTVQDKIDIASDTTICIPVILDLHLRKVVWADIALTSQPYFYNNVEGNVGGMTLMGKALTTLVKPTLYDLFSLHVQARGVLTNDAIDAETVFSADSGITPFEIETIMAEFL